MAKQYIRELTDNFLLKSQGSTTYPVPTPYGGFFEVNGNDALLTGAVGAELPMRIIMAGKDGSRIELVLLVNPENMNHGKTQAVQTAYTRNGYVVQPWGYNQDTLSVTGKSAGFMVAGTGMTNDNRIYSFGYSNFLGLMNSYKNNGYTFFDQSKIAEITRVIILVHGVEIYYDGTLMMGHFSNFTLNEEAGKPFNFSYNFEFIISTLSGDYSEVRGHFHKVPAVGENIGLAKLLSDAKNTKKAVFEVSKTETEVKAYYEGNNAYYFSEAPDEPKLPYSCKPISNDPNVIFNLYKTEILEAAKEYGVDPKLITAVITAESRGDPNAVSKTGAIGLMQLMPKTAAGLGVTDSFNIRNNIRGGAKYLKELSVKYPNDKSLVIAAYNAGPGAVDKARGIPRNAETTAYVPAVQYNEQVLKTNQSQLTE